MTDKYTMTKESDDGSGVIRDKKCCCSECEPVFKTINGIKPFEPTKSFYVDVNRIDEYTPNGSSEKPYKLIQPAINAASSGTLIIMAQGIYNENLTLKPGVYLKSASGLQPGVTVTGKVSWASGAGTILMSGIYVLNTTDHAVGFSGVDKQKLRAYNCKFETNSAGVHHALNHSNTNADSEIFLKDSLVQVRNSSGGAKGIETATDSGGSIGLDNTSVRVVDDVDHTAINLRGAVAYWQRMDEIRGRVLVSGLASCNITLDGMYASTLSCLDTNSAGLTLLSTIVLSTTASPAVTGAGAFAFSSIGYASTGQGLAATLNGGAGAAIGAIPGESADGIIYDNTISGLVATRVKVALDELAAAKKTYSFPMSEGGGIGYARNQTGYMSYHYFTGSEDAAKVVFPAGKATKITLRVSTNSISDPTVVTLRKNGADTDITFTIPADTTGPFTDDAHSVDIADGDELCLKIAIGVGTAVDSIYFKGGTVEMEV